MTAVLLNKFKEQPTTLTAHRGVQQQVLARLHPPRSQRLAAIMCRRTITEVRHPIVIPLLILERLDQ